MFQKGEKNINHKLRGDQANKIRAFYKKGVSQQALADRYGVSQNCIFRIVNNLTWKDTSSGADAPPSPPGEGEDERRLK